jgi:diguanylate cyclase (GGDEF)-like protein/PAS domain S-box-containing protein
MVATFCNRMVLIAYGTMRARYASGYPIAGMVRARIPGAIEPYTSVAARIGRPIPMARSWAGGHAAPLNLGAAGALAFGCILACGTASAVERGYFAQRVVADDELTQNTVTAIVQDRTGFLWVGTQGGLHRYDGYRFLPLQHDPLDRSSIPDSFITALAESGTDPLIVGTVAGAAWLDAAAQRFVPIETTAGAASTGPMAVSALLIDAKRQLWLGTRRGAVFAGPPTGPLTEITPAPQAPDDGEVTDLEQAADGTIWAAVGPTLRRFADTTAPAMTLALPEGTRAHALLRARDGTLWLGASTGLHRIASEDRVERVWPAEVAAVRSAVVDLAEAPGGRLWLGVFGRGLIAFDPANLAVEAIEKDLRLGGSLPEESLRRVFLDRSGLLWVGGDVTGLTRLDPSGTRFALLYDENALDSALETNHVRSLYEDRDGPLWIGTDGDGLKRYDFGARRFEHFGQRMRNALPEPLRETELRVQAILPAEADQLWVGTNLGLFRVARSNGSSRLIAAERDIHALAPAADGALWLGLHDAGLERFDPATATASRLGDATRADAALWSQTVLALTSDRAGRLWIGTFGGLNLLDADGITLRRLALAEPGSGVPVSTPVRAILEARDGGIWVATHAGLWQLESMNEGVARWRLHATGEAPAWRTVYALGEDDAGRIWLSGNRGLAVLEPDSGRIRRFALEDGLQGLEFNGGAATRMRDGRLAFGGLAGINFVTPDRIEASTYEPTVALTAIQRGERWQPVLDQTPGTTIRLAPDQRVLGFEFAALDFGAPARNRYEYRLDGFDDRWIALGNQRQVSFTNLDPGSYTLRLRGTNRDQVWSPRELAIPIEVNPPFWRSLPALLGYAALAFALLVLVLRALRRRREREQRFNRELREREARLRVAIWGSGDEFWDLDMRANQVVRIGADNLLGFEPEHQLSAEDWRSKAVHPDDLARVEQLLAEHVAGKREFFESEHRVRGAEGEWIWVRSRGKIVARDERGQPLRIAGTARDISSTRAAERDRRIAEEVIRSMSEAVTVCDLDFNFISVNPAFTRITGYIESEIRGKPSTMLNCDQHTDEFHQTLRKTLARTGHWSGEIWQRRKDGEEFLCWLELSEVADANGARTHWVGVLTDITDRKRAEQELRYLANYDTLTGLPNRTLLGERLAHALIRARRHGSRVAVLFLDLDRFKHVNDSMGHAAGDRLLKAAGARITASVRDSDTVARLGGDEFTVVIEDLTEHSQAERIAQKLIDAFLVPLDIDGRTEVVISPSIGISIYPDHGQVPTDLLKFADTAMYQAKEKGRNTYQIYTEAMDARARLRASMVGYLHKAIERGELSLVYQPRLSLSDNRITGVEALLRWRNPDIGSVPPSTFIPLAEETGLIVPIGEWVLREACNQLKRWTSAGIGGLTVAVNISMLQLLRGELYQVLRAMLESFQIPAHRIELELTESMVMANAEQSISTLTQLKSLGVNVAIDDFGTGYSSLAYLKRLPIDTLKIDKEFVGDITTDPDDEAITATVITMAHSLGLDVVAEGVELAEQLDYLREQGCDEVQGNLISPPLDPERCQKFLLEHRAEEAKASPREVPAVAGGGPR